MALTLKELVKKKPLLLPGHRLCAGCAAGVVARLVMAATRKPTVVTIATGCLEVATTIYPYTSWAVPWVHSAFENAAATASGIEAGFKALKKRGLIKDVPDVIAFGGDGGTIDIGLQALSGAVERGHDFLYILYDNEAYMNTGIQRSGGTPYAAWTTTTPAGKVVPGKPQWRKPIAHVVASHGPHVYVATASPAYWRDLVTKVRKGLEWEGPAFIHVISPCPRGWRFPPDMTIYIAKLAVQTCFFPLWEYEKGEYKLSPPSMVYARAPEKKLPVEEYLKLQGRFRHLFKPVKREELIKRIQETVDYEWERLLRLCGAVQKG